MINKYLKNESSTPLVYFLNTEDVQNIANESIGRDLTTEELSKIIEPLANNIDWAEAIEIAVEQTIVNS